MKVASAIVRRIFIDMGSAVNIITWDCLKKMTHLERDVVPLVHPILGFGGQEVNHTGMIRLPLHFGDKLKAENLEVDFLIRRRDNVIVGRSTLHKESRPQHPGGWSPRLPGHPLRRKVPHGVRTALLIALLPGLGRPLSLSFGKRLLQLALQILLLGLRGIRFCLQLLPAPLVSGHEALQLSTLSHDPYSSSKSLDHSHLVFGDFNGFRGSAITKFKGKGRALREVPPATWEVAPAIFRVPEGSHGLGVPPLLFPVALGIGHHLLGGGIPDLEDCQLRPHLLCVKLKGVRPLHQLYRLSHELWDGLGLIVLPYEVMEIASRLLRCPEGIFDWLTLGPTERPGYTRQATQLTSRDKGANVVPGCRHDLRRRQFVLVQNVFDYRVKRKPKAVIESRTVDRDAFSGRLIHYHIRLRDYESIPSVQEIFLLKSHPLQGERPLFLSTDLPEVDSPSWDEELVDTPFEDECLDDPSEEWEDAPFEEELILVEATLATGFEELGAEQGLPWVPSASSSSRDLMREVDLVFAIYHTWKSFIKSLQ
ncbi:hypothetical protein Cgig2_025651 [Carnegiea gigantea]|uniref:Uncharacterized protein n=1 Tax=Carnegiea gigantea TaxID=171969 RepID=A0A9Q1GGF7_9CARY|nr:hypothetical protein Cgig2_025651 [Carnegiea gigantea]